MKVRELVVGAVAIVALAGGWIGGTLTASSPTPTRPAVAVTASASCTDALDRSQTMLSAYIKVGAQRITLGEANALFEANWESYKTAKADCLAGR